MFGTIKSSNREEEDVESCCSWNPGTWAKIHSKPRAIRAEDSIESCTTWKGAHPSRSPGHVAHEVTQLDLKGPSDGLDTLDRPCAPAQGNFGELEGHETTSCSPRSRN